MSFCRRLHKTGKPWYKWMTRRELRELREAHRAEQKTASPPPPPEGHKDGAKEDSLATAAPAYKDVPQIVVSNGHVVPDIGQNQMKVTYFIITSTCIPPAVVMSATPDVRRKAETRADAGTENGAFEEDDSEPSDEEDGGETEEEKVHPAVAVTPSLEAATEEAIQILEASLPPSPDEETPDPFEVAALVHANGNTRRV